MPTLSVILITRNESANIRACLESVAFADEIIVVDSGSTDDTVAIARSMGAQVYEHDWPGFGPQKNRALNYATCDWVFSIDADERVTPALRDEIQQALQRPAAAGYCVPRHSEFCGVFVRHCGWYPDYVLRLFERGRGRFLERLVHECVAIDGVYAKLHTPLLHYSYRTREDIERKVSAYSSAAAAQMFQAGKRANCTAGILPACWTFVRTWLLQLGFLDGRTGWHIATMNLRTTWLKYRKLRALSHHEIRARQS
ncbi:glycosyltransferase family 2 protein [Ferrigenium sp. UT5]|uniref:glycosyltransferase family 2 protein n=1 Tax=Ferrigenium sp. UT5 TaxID=3242105 RepID=UPI0035512B4B